MYLIPKTRGYINIFLRVHESYITIYWMYNYMVGGIRYVNSNNNNNNSVYNG